MRGVWLGVVNQVDKTGGNGVFTMSLLGEGVGRSHEGS